jgi:hypothetical protein
MFFRIFLIFFIAFLYLTPKANATIVAGVVRNGGDIPENSPIGADATFWINVNNPPENVYLLLNNSTTGPGYSNVGDYLEVSNPETGKTIYYDSQCSSNKMPPLNLRSVLDPAVFERNGYQYLKFTFINKCSNAKIMDYLYFIYVTADVIGEFSPIMINGDGTSNNPIPTAFPLHDFKQTDPKWGGAHLDNSSNCGTMYSFGCAVTSVADVVYSYGKSLLKNNIQLDPGSLNNWLAGNSGFSGCSIIWAQAAAASSIGAPSMLFRNNSSNWVAGQQAIDNALQQGNLPIIGINTSFGTHFLVLSKKLADVNGKPDYSIVDPALYPFVQNSIGKTGKPLSQAYGGFDKVFEVVVYKNGSNPQNSLSIRAHSPVQMLVTDPFGNTTGYDSSSQSISENIPDSSYGIENGIAPVDGSSPAMTEVKYFQQINPTEGDYNIQLIGTGDGSYTIDYSKTDEQGNVSTQVLKGFAAKGVTETFTMDYAQDATQKPVVNKEVTFAVLKSDIKALYAQKQIKNAVVYATLLLQANLAEKATQINRQPLGNKLAVIPLKTFQIELNKQRGKQVTEDGYQILMNDVMVLINSLQGGSPTPTPQPGGS